MPNREGARQPEGGHLYASPDGLIIDPRGVMWVQTDVSPSVLLKHDHAIYGNNQMLAVDPGHA
jgi:secreted PhoX family phosphatase